MKYIKVIRNFKHVCEGDMLELQDHDKRIYTILKIHKATKDVLRCDNSYYDGNTQWRATITKDDTFYLHHGNKYHWKFFKRTNKHLNKIINYRFKNGIQ